MLDDILRSVRARLDEVRDRTESLREEAVRRGPGLDAAAALTAEGLSVIAEVKRRSPSAGPIDEDLDPTALARAYASGGAAAISVLTEPDHFAGSLDDLETVAAAVEVPVLRKDFVLDPAQIWEARARGADMVLLIVAILEDDALDELLVTAHESGLHALVEAHTEDEARRAVDVGARIIGVNNRDLATFDVDLATAERIRPVLGDDVIAVAESGVSSPDGARRMAEAGYDAILVGEAAVRSGDPVGFVRSLREAP
ncbi:MAG: indole-3-glycerol phosphate synthase TrpC [Acidimicrobiia bacterium]|nr:indole-3-glycerol phosphate synthase TrpC [Acidimicrobiia bacterium]